MKDLLELYKALLATGWMSADERGIITLAKSTKHEPIHVGGKQLVLPTVEQLRNPDSSVRIMFNPLHESVLKGESDVITQLRHSYAVRLNYTIGTLLRSLLDLAASTGRHAGLSPVQSEILSPLKNSDEKTVVDFARILINATKKLGVEAAFVTLYLKRGGKVDDKIYSRAGIVTFPVYEELLKDQDTYFDVDLRKKDIPTLRALFRHVFPGIDDHYYNKGSNSDVAPYLDALVKTVAGVVGATNEMVTMYSKFIEDSEGLIIQTDWADAFENLAAWVPELRMIPAQFSTDGADRKIDGLVLDASTTVPDRQQLHHPDPVASHGRTFSDMVSIRDQQTQQQQYQQQQYNPTYVPQQVSAPPVQTSRGLNFGELMRRRGVNNPQQQQGNGFNNQAFQNPYANGL